MKLQVASLLYYKALRLQGNHSFRLHALFIHIIIASVNAIKITKIIDIIITITTLTWIVFITHE